MKPRLFSPLIALSLCCLLGLPMSALGDEVPAIGEKVTTIARFPEAIHFYAPDETDVLVGQGLYQVSRVGDSMQLKNLSSQSSLTLKAVIGRHEESLPEPVAVTVYGDVVDEPDITVLILMLPDGTKLSAEGSYSGIRPRGLRDRIQAAQAQIQQAASQAKVRMEALRQQVQILQDLKRQVNAMPRLSPEQAAKLKREAMIIRDQNKEMLQELARRLQANRALVIHMIRKGPGNWSPIDIQNFLRVIIGSGNNMLRLSTWPTGDLSVAASNPGIMPRGTGGGFAFSAGASLDASAVVGGGVGLVYPWMEGAGFVKYLAYGGSLGAQLGASGNLDLGFWHSRPDQLAGCDYGVQLAGAYIGGVGVAVVFQGTPGTDFRWSGLQVDPGAGAEIVGTILYGCTRMIGTP